MKIAVVGTGYVGIPTGVGFAQLGNDVVCIDNDAQKIELLQQGKVPLFEKGLEELFHKNRQTGRIKFTTSMKEGVSGAEVVIIAVGTPPHPVTKEADTSFLHAAVEELAQYLTNYTVIATKSTVPVGTGDELEVLVKNKNPNAQFDVVSLPEFLREGVALYDFFRPDRIIIGTESKRAIEVIKRLYKPFEDKTTMLFVKRRSSETIKYASNAFLAMKIHYINEMADFCEKAGADVLEVAKGMGLDSRIGARFLNPGPGYGGSCFPKDTNAMAQMGRKYDVDLTLIEAAIAGNDARKKDMAKRIINAVSDLEKPRIAVLGLAFKDGTDDCRESPAMEIVMDLLDAGQDVAAYDPKAMPNAKVLTGDRKIYYAKTEYDAADGADVLVLLTEWSYFRKLDFARLKSIMKHKRLLDLRNLVSPAAAVAEGFEYHGVGRK
ncbi:UDPglucose 6-dehydrogenase [Elusimicrobium posterum]|uniref:UDP-glucose dehydrogenase family protein n=1 Tax=Elusimicrobium posterum TaxID=3116653 RepID=UPI003C72076E